MTATMVVVHLLLSCKGGVLLVREVWNGNKHYFCDLMKFR